MRSTSIWEKALASAVNTIITLIVSLPFFLIWGFGSKWKLSVLIIFFLVEFLFSIFGKNKDLGMRVVGSKWRGRHSIIQYFLYNIFYTMSFSTLFFSVWFPLDLFLINILLIQLPCILATGTTFHGYISGLETIKYR